MDEKKAPPSPNEALTFLDGILAGVAGSRQDHIAIQGALGIVGQALATKLDIEPAEAVVVDEATEDTK